MLVVMAEAESHSTMKHGNPAVCVKTLKPFVKSSVSRRPLF